MQLAAKAHAASCMSPCNWLHRAPQLPALCVRSFDSRSEFRRDGVVQALAYIRCKADAIVYDPVPLFLLEVIQIPVPYTQFHQSVEDACIEIVSGSYGADSGDGRYGIVLPQGTCAQRHFIGAGCIKEVRAIKLDLLFIDFVGFRQVV